MKALALRAAQGNAPELNLLLPAGMFAAGKNQIECYRQEPKMLKMRAE